MLMIKMIKIRMGVCTLFPIRFDNGEDDGGFGLVYDDDSDTDDDGVGDGVNDDGDDDGVGDEDGVGDGDDDDGVGVGDEGDDDDGDGVGDKEIAHALGVCAAEFLTWGEFY